MSRPEEEDVKIPEEQSELITFFFFKFEMAIPLFYKNKFNRRIRRFIPFIYKNEFIRRIRRFVG